MRIVAILATYNEERFLRACLEHYLQQGLEVFILDNESSDDSLGIASDYLDRHVIGIETIPRNGTYHWMKILRRKEELADEIDADWLMHADPDEIRIAPSSDLTLAEAIAQADRDGYNAINFMEYTFLPVHESPDHDHADFQKSMRWYYPFAPRYPHRLNLWKKQQRRQPGLRATLRELRNNRRLTPPSINLAASGGHVVSFPGIRPYPIDFKLKHYLVLSLQHAIQKYVHKDFDANEVADLHGWRATATAQDFRLPYSSQMRAYLSDDALDSSDPLRDHLIVM